MSSSDERSSEEWMAVGAGIVPGGVVLGRDAPDSRFRYPAGYRIGRIAKNYPAG